MLGPGDVPTMHDRAREKADLREREAAAHDYAITNALGLTGSAAKGGAPPKPPPEALYVRMPEMKKALQFVVVGIHEVR